MYIYIYHYTHIHKHIIHRIRGAKNLGDIRFFENLVDFVMLGGGFNLVFVG